MAENQGPAPSEDSQSPPARPHVRFPIPPFPQRYIAITDHLNRIPRELTHQIISDLPFRNVLAITLSSTRFEDFPASRPLSPIEETFLSHILYSKTFNAASFRRIQRWFRLLWSIMACRVYRRLGPDDYRRVLNDVNRRRSSVGRELLGSQKGHLPHLYSVLESESAPTAQYVGAWFNSLLPYFDFDVPALSNWIAKCYPDAKPPTSDHVSFLGFSLERDIARVVYLCLEDYIPYMPAIVRFAAESETIPYFFEVSPKEFALFPTANDLPYKLDEAEKRWTIIYQGEKRLNTIKSQQLLRITSLVEGNPGLFRPRSAPTIQVTKRTQEAMVQKFRRDAKLILRPHLESGKQFALSTFQGSPRLPIVATHLALRLFVKTILRFPPTAIMATKEDDENGGYPDVTDELNKALNGPYSWRRAGYIKELEKKAKRWRNDVWLKELSKIRGKALKGIWKAIDYPPEISVAIQRVLGGMDYIRIDPDSIYLHPPPPPRPPPEFVFPEPREDEEEEEEAEVLEETKLPEPEMPPPPPPPPLFRTEFTPFSPSTHTKLRGQKQPTFLTGLAGPWPSTLPEPFHSKFDQTASTVHAKERWRMMLPFAEEEIQWWEDFAVCVEWFLGMEEKWTFRSEHAGGKEFQKVFLGEEGEEGSVGEYWREHLFGGKQCG